MVLVKNLNIFYLSILGKTGQNNTFHDILKGKNVYLDHGFGQNFKNFPSPYFRQNRRE